MMAPNPHWYKQEAEVYQYYDRSLAPNILHLSAWSLIIYKSIYARESSLLLWLGIFLMLIGLAANLIWSDRSRGRFETRYDHLSFYRGDKLLVHESMRDLVSLEPTIKGAKLQFHTVLFENGQSVNIYPNLHNHDALTTRLQSYLLPDSRPLLKV